jgi:nitrite reductase (NO-forming)
MKKSSTVRLTTAVSAFILVTGLMLFPAASKSLATSITTTPQLASVTNPSSMQAMQGAGVNLAMDPAGFTQVSVQSVKNMMQNDPAKVHKVTLIANETDLKLPQGNVIHAFTWNGTVPGPTVRVPVGDMINVTIINLAKNKNPHSLDNHAALISAVPNFGPVLPGYERSYAFVATQPGVFKYHCEGNAVLAMDQHVFSGMVGIVIVDPANGYTGFKYPTYTEDGKPVNMTVSPNAKEVQYILSEWYLTKDGNYNQTAMFNHQPTYTWINGIPFGYDPVVTKTKGAMPLHFKVGDHVRFFLLNEGDANVNFHIVGWQINRVMQDQILQGMGVATYYIGGSSGAIMDVVFTQPGVYAPVNHDYANLFKGQASIVVVDGPDGEPGKTLGLKNYNLPSNAVPPMGKNSIPVQTTPYWLGTPMKLTMAQLHLPPKVCAKAPALKSEGCA